jgi:superfamily II DNA or RNA helicase
MSKRVTLKPFQGILKKKMHLGFRRNNKVLVNALCGTGKTLLAESLIEDIVAEGKRVAISTYSVMDIRKQWYEKIEQYSSDLIKHTQIVVSKADFAKNRDRSLPLVCNGNISNKKLITIFIPQSIKSHMGIFDYIIIDEAHEYLDKGTQLKEIIKNHSHKNTKFLGLTGTGHELIGAERFFEGSELVIYDMLTGLRDGAVNKCEFHIEAFKFELPKNCYKKNELNNTGCSRVKRAFINKRGKKLLKEPSYVAAKLTSLINNVKGKTLVVIPHGRGLEKLICNHINVEIGKNREVAVYKTTSLDQLTIDRNEAKFRKMDSGYDFMVVKDMCGTGWDFPELLNVIDFTFTKNPGVMVQRAARAIRKVNPNESSYKKPGTSGYYYCIDQTKSINETAWFISYAMSLTIEMCFRGYQSGALKGVPRDIFDKILDGLSGYKKDSIKFSFDDLLKCEEVKHKRVRTITLKDIITSNVTVDKYLRSDIIDYISKEDCCNPSPSNYRVFYAVRAPNTSIRSCLNAIKAKDLKIYRAIFGSRDINTVLKSAENYVKGIKSVCAA